MFFKKHYLSKIINEMAASILIGFFYFLLVLLSGWLKVLFTFVSISFANGIPYLYLFLGYSFGSGDVLKHSFWPGYLLGIFLVVLLVLKASKISEQNGNGINTVGTCGSTFIVGSLIGLIIGVII